MARACTASLCCVGILASSCAITTERPPVGVSYGPIHDASPRRPCAPAGVDEPGQEEDIRRAIDAIDAPSFHADIARMQGVRDGKSPALARATQYVDDVMTKSGFVVRRQRVSTRDGGVHENVIAERKGSSAVRAGSKAAGHDHQPVIIATAHLDTVAGSPGADDNASGVATLLAIARATARSQRAAETTVRLVAFALEEEGFIGSLHYVRSLSESERRRIIAAYNFDMVAFTRSGEHSQEWPPDAEIMADLRQRPLRRIGDFIGAVTLARSKDEPSTLAPLRQARAYVHDLVIEDAEFPPVLLRFAPDLERGDHVAFWEVGIPAVDIGDTAELRNPNYHAPSDTLDTLDLGFATKVARWAAAAVLIARGPRECPR